VYLINLIRHYVNTEVIMQLSRAWNSWERNDQLITIVVLILQPILFGKLSVVLIHSLHSKCHGDDFLPVALVAFYKLSPSELCLFNPRIEQNGTFKNKPQLKYEITC